MTFHSTFRKHKVAIFVSAAANIGSILFGFDTGVAGGVVTLQSFKTDFHLSTTPKKLASTSGNIVALLNLGAFLGALLPAFLSHYLGRRHLLLTAGFFFLLGGILQTAAQPPSLSMIYGGRVLAGFGVGVVSTTAPIFVAECSPKKMRGVMMGAFEMFLVSGGMLAYWSVYGCSLHMRPTSKQWRTPLSLQIILAVFVMAGSLITCESPRWLAKQGRWDEATKVLCSLRGAKESEAEIVEELAEMRAQIDEEVALTNGRRIREMLKVRNFQRLLWGVSVAFFTMWCGHNAILYYGPAVFKQIGFTSQNSSLLASGVFTCIKFISTVIFLVSGVQIFKRQTMLLGGSVLHGGLPTCSGCCAQSLSSYCGRRIWHTRCQGNDGTHLPLRCSIFSVLGAFGLGLHGRDLSNAPARLRNGDLHHDDLAHELRRVEDRANSNFERWLEDLDDFRYVEHCGNNLLVVST